MLFAALLLAALLAAAFGFTAWKTREIERRFPPIGETMDVGGQRLHFVHIPGPAPAHAAALGPAFTPAPEHDQHHEKAAQAVNADLPPIVFIHGASGNLRDQMTAFAAPLAGRAEMLFVDRPGHGYSQRGGEENGYPDGQAAAIARLMKMRDVGPAIICGHSFGGAIAASFALNHPEMTAGLLLLAPATHPWPGGVDWYYTLASRPVLGRLFTRLASLPAGLMLMEKATRSVFHPNPRPERYVEDGAPALVLRPENFRDNAIDVAQLNDYVTRVAPRYAEIEAPTIVITGDSDRIVAPEIHTAGIAASVTGSRVVTIRGLGHKPDYVTADVAIAALETLSGRPRDLDAAGRTAEARIGGHRQIAAPELDFSIEKS